MRRLQLHRAMSLWTRKFKQQRSTASSLLPVNMPERLEPRLLLSSDAIVNGLIFNDLNGDGVRDANEGGMPGVLVYGDLNHNDQHDAATEPSVFSGLDGMYQLTNLPRETVSIRQATPQGYEQTTPDEDQRLFATIFRTDEIVELHPTSGAVLHRFTSPVPIDTSRHGLALEGDSLYLMRAGHPTIYEMRADTGELIRSIPVGASSVGGLAVIDGIAYALDISTGNVIAVDLETEQVIRTLAVGETSGRILSGGMGELPEAGRLVIGTNTNEVLLVDPQTGAVTSSFHHNRGLDGGLTAVGGEIYIGFRVLTTGGVVQVYDASGVFQRQFATEAPVFGLGGFGGTGWQVDLTDGVASGIDFGNALQGVAGQVFEDLDGDGVKDPGEPAMAGVRIYADLNENFRYDGPAEPSVLSAADGSYVLLGLDEATVSIRQVLPERYVQTTPKETARLFGTDRETDEILELDPVTGQVLRRIASPIPIISQQHGLAYEDGSLYLMHTNHRMLHQIDAETGQIIESFSVPVTVVGGLAVLDGVVYVFDPSADIITGFDLATRTIVNTLFLGQTTGKNLSGGLGELPASGELIVTTTTREVLTFDAQTGVVTSSFNHNLPNPDVGVAAFGGEIYLAFLTGPSSGKLQVYDQAGVLQREIEDLPPMFGLAGELTGGWRIDLAAGPGVDIDFGNITGSVRGVVFDDLNGDGRQDGTEPGLADVLVYADLDNNDQHDPTTEPFALTAADGTYHITNVPGDSAIVRQVVPERYQQTAPNPNASRLFTTNLVTREIVEIDPATGLVRASLPVPTATMSFSHSISFDGEALYYVQGGDNSVYKLSPDTGQVLATFASPTSNPTGVAALDGKLYIAQGSLIHVLDIATGGRSVFSAGRVLLALDGIEATGQLVATTSTSDILIVDVELKRPVASFRHNQGAAGDFAVAAIGSDIYVGFTSGKVQVYSRYGEFQREFIQAFSVRSLAGATLDSGRAVDLSPGFARAVTFGAQAVTGDLRGMVFEDIDGDGTQDSDEPGMADVVTYLDRNSNGRLDLVDRLILSPDAHALGIPFSQSTQDVSLWQVNIDGEIVGPVLSVDSGGFASAGARVFGHHGVDPASWSSFRAMRIDLHQSTSSVSINFIADDEGDQGLLQGFDAQGNLLDEYRSAPQRLGTSQTMTVVDPRLAYVIARGDFAVEGMLDNLRVTFTEQTVATDAAGQYAFADLAPGQYRVGQLEPDGFIVTTQPGAIDLQAGEVVDGLNFGNQRLAPVIRTLSVTPSIINEGETVTLTGMFIDPSIGQTHRLVISWGDATGQEIILPAGARSFEVTHFYGDDFPPASPSNLNQIHVSVHDDVDGFSHEFVEIVVHNVAPMIDSVQTSADSVGSAGAGDTVMLDATFTDPGVRDTHMTTVDWGDGVTTPAIVSFRHGVGTIHAEHAYSTGGIFDVVVTLADDDTGSTAAQTRSIITGVGINHGSLQVIGTAAADDVQINLSGDAVQQIVVTAAFLGTSYIFDPTAANRIEVHLGDGDDTAAVGPKVIHDTFIFGGLGNDSIKGAGGANVLAGGDGDDTLIGGPGRDILLGGMGRDVAIGKGDEDVLVGGRFTGEDDVNVLASLLEQWRRQDMLYEQRVDSLKNLGLNGSNVHDDGMVDVLRGLLALDWFIAGTGDKTDHHDDEALTAL